MAHRSVDRTLDFDSKKEGSNPSAPKKRAAVVQWIRRGVVGPKTRVQFPPATKQANVAEWVYALVSKTSLHKKLWVRVPPSA